MNPKAFIVFLIITTIVVIVASFSVATRYSVHKVGLEDRPVFPGFAEKAQTVDTIIVQDSEKTLNLNRKGSNWVIADRQDYRASNEVISNLMLGLSELRLREAKTKKSNLYERLQVEDIRGKKAKSILLTVKAKNQELAKLIVGKVNSDVAGSSNVGRYIRMPGQIQSWLASGRLDIPGAVSKWVKPEFLNVASSRVEKVEVRHPNGEIMIVSRVGEKKFKIENMPENMVVEYQSDIDNMGDGLDKLELEDVMATGMVQFPKDKTINTEIRTKDGLIVNAKMIDIDDGHFWASFIASSEPNASDVVKQEVVAINSRVLKWVYELPAHKYRYMSRKHSDVLKKPELKKSQKKIVQ